MAKLKKKSVEYLLSQAQFHGSRRFIVRKYRLIWCVILGIMFCVSLCIIGETIQRFLTNPTIIIQKLAAREEISFPSVLICPEIIFSDKKKDDFVQDLIFPPEINVTTSDFRNKLQQLAAFFSTDVAYNLDDLMMIETVLEYNYIDVETAGEKLNPTCEEVLLRCRFMRRTMDCKELFTMMLTQFGYCCVFSGRSLRQEIREFGIHVVKPEERYMTRESGPLSGLMAVVDTSQKQSDIDLTYKWAIVQYGQQYVESSSNNGTPLTTGKETWLGYSWVSFTVHRGIRSLKQHLRKCRFTTEVLKYFPIYYRGYCYVECEMAHTLDKCNCLRMTHPQIPGIRTCRAENLPCAVGVSFTHASKICDCPRTCDASLFQHDVQTYDLHDNHNVDSFYDNLDLEKVSVLRVYISSQDIKQYLRVPIFTELNLFAQLGGIINVFFGCSILTSLEIIQIVWHYVKNKYHEKYKQPTIIKYAESEGKKHRRRKSVKFAVHQKNVLDIKSFKS